MSCDIRTHTPARKEFYELPAVLLCYKNLFRRKQTSTASDKSHASRVRLNRCGGSFQSSETAMMMICFDGTVFNSTPLAYYIYIYIYIYIHMYTYIYTYVYV